ncbi:hypothetical protein [Methyloversatilis thermotolerans]|uniref:hypothetical protein n=1 Tax=Methyloversatilis thermotolerans TaxID=1346290 RepID=UPI000369ABFB|nr:hypothetical protein [Methyloversatilis thermotolerans]
MTASLPKRRLASWLIALMLVVPLTPALARWAAGLSGAVLLSELCRGDDGASGQDAGRNGTHGCPHACCALASPGPLACGLAVACSLAAEEMAGGREHHAAAGGMVQGLAEARAPPPVPA